MKKLLLSLAIITVLAPAALAEGTKAAAQNKLGNNPVRSTNGNCVRTKWDDTNDVCAPAKAPEPTPVVEAPKPEPKPEPATQLTEDQRTVYFDFNKSDLKAESKTKLDTLIAAVVASKGVQKVTAVGYTDQIGNDEMNQKLSQRRADAVNAYIDSKVTIPTEAKTIAGKGKAEATAGCAKGKKRAKKIACMANERRVEVQFTYAK